MASFIIIVYLISERNSYVLEKSFSSFFALAIKINLVNKLYYSARLQSAACSDDDFRLGMIDPHGQLSGREACPFFIIKNLFSACHPKSCARSSIEKEREREEKFEVSMQVSKIRQAQTPRRGYISQLVSRSLFHSCQCHSSTRHSQRRGLTHFSIRGTCSSCIAY